MSHIEQFMESQYSRAGPTSRLTLGASSAGQPAYAPRTTNRIQFALEYHGESINIQHADVSIAKQGLDRQCTPKSFRVY